MGVKLESAKHIIIFEPWNLGDLIISAYFSRELYTIFDIRTSFICKKEWVEWISLQDFVEDVFCFSAPWNRKVGRHPFHYNISHILKLRKWVRKKRYDFLWDTRGDLRHKVFLKLLRINNIISIRYPSNLNAYQRINLLIDRFGGSRIPTKEKLPDTIKSNRIFLFLDSYWPNRRVPLALGQKLIECLVHEGFMVRLVLPPGKKYHFIKALLYLSGDESFQIIRGSINEVACALEDSALCISTDSAWLHMSFYLGVPAIGLFGFLNANEWAPPGTRIIYPKNPLSARDRYRLRYMDKQPLKDINVDDVVHVVKSVIG
ncbi:MAG: glycosyltransferase family 9 protein [Deltaproteobacteria bacterium]|nr:glycosyltransferase family 9 protein [Deltaproteobacteria bacterium]MBW2301490.1 glycosyltransferase family 9 protein [Deltaproteobacteria bacterium]